MKIAVIGTGAMGSVYAGLLAAAGNEVWAIDTWQAHVDAIRSDGLRVEGASGDRVVRLPATSRASEAGGAQLIVIATKAMDVEAAAQSALDLLSGDTTVLTIQNGLGSADTAMRVLGTDRVVVGVAGGFGASIKAPGHAHHNAWEFLRLGELKEPVTERITSIANTWRKAGFQVTTHDGMEQMIWHKLICNTCYSGACTVLHSTIGEVLDNPSAWQVASACAVEAFRVAHARGIELTFENPVEYVREFGLKMPRARPSVLLDHLAKRKSEIEFINGAIVSTARECGTAAPYNEAITALVKAKEEQFTAAG